MPRTSAVELPGCPPMRAIGFDAIGLIKVIETCDKPRGIPKVVSRWGDPDFARAVVATSFDDCKDNPLVAVARKNASIELLNPVTGDIYVSILDDNNLRSEDDVIIGLHLFRHNKVDAFSRLIACSMKGVACMRSIEISYPFSDSSCSTCVKTWNLSTSGTLCCFKVDWTENYAVFGGKGIEAGIWDLKQEAKIWTGKPPTKNKLGIFIPTCFTSAAFLHKNDHRKFVAGTNNHQVHLYDISAQRRPVISFDFRQSPIKAVIEDLDANTIYIGNSCGDLASVDIRTGKLLGCFLGKSAGSIKSIARHPVFPMIASCGLDGYVRFWDVKTRQLLSAVFLKQHVLDVVFDSNFVAEAEDKTASNGLNIGVTELDRVVKDLKTRGTDGGTEIKRSKRKKIKRSVDRSDE